MQRWWWRSVAACVSVLVVAGLVALVAGAVGADRRTAVRLAADAPPGAPAETPAPGPSTPTPTPTTPTTPAPLPRAVDDVSASSIEVVEGWGIVPTQTVIDAPPGRFGVVVQRGEGTVVLVGRVDPARVPPSPDPAALDPAALDALGAESGRLAEGYVDILVPGGRSDVVAEDAAPIGGLPARTTVRRVAAGELEGALVRVSTVSAPGRTVAVLGVARPGPTLDADATSADAVARSLRLEPAP